MCKFASKHNQITLRVSLNMIGDSNDETNFPHKSLFTDTKVSQIR